MTSPGTKLLLATVLVMGLAAMVLWSATQRAWFGLILSTSSDGQVQLTALAQPIAQPVALPATITAILIDGQVHTPTALDIVEEPDAFDSYAAYEAFLQRQQLWHDRMEADTWTLQVQPPRGSPRDLVVHRQSARPIRHLPAAFWVQLITGIAGFIIGAWVLVLRAKDVAAWCFMGTGAGLMASAFSAAIYSTRELALGATLFRALGVVNKVGAVGFGCALFSLFLFFPRPLISARWLWGIGVAFGLWFVLVITEAVGSPVTMSYVPVLLLSFAIVSAICVQWWQNRRNPSARAALRWFGLVTFATISCFLILAAIPALFGDVPPVSQGVAFGFFLILYAGLALGLRRYRLFDLDRWAFYLLLWVLAGLALVGLDIVFLSVLRWNESASVLASLVICGFLYLPLRGWLWQRVVARPRLDEQTLFHRVVDIALTPSPDYATARWQRLLQDLFDPLHIEFLAETIDTPSALLVENGERLFVPAVSHSPALELHLAGKGKRLFSPMDVERANNTIDMLRYVYNNRNAWEQGANEERKRIAQDLHDDLGSRLLTGMRQSTVDDVHATMQLAVADMRNIVRGLAGDVMPLDQLIAELRQETTLRCDAAGVEIHWPIIAENTAHRSLDYRVYRNLMSTIRELISNVLQHAHARTLTVRIETNTTHLVLQLIDDGRGYDGQGQREGGQGSKNLHKRVDSLHGTLSFKANTPGTCTTLSIPLSKDSPTHDERSDS